MVQCPDNLKIFDFVRLSRIRDFVDLLRKYKIGSKTRHSSRFLKFWNVFHLHSKIVT